ncbi:MAG: Rieske 2Fe-2S domain-containing protein [Myxococcales bacterium]
MALTTVYREEDLWQGEKVRVEVGGKGILLVNIAGAVCAYDDRCPHLGWPLSRGRLIGQELTCGLHGWSYDACTGRGVNPRGTALHQYPVQVVNGAILVDTDEA